MKTTFRISLAVCLALVAGRASAQHVAPPVLTFVPDIAGGLRPVIGIPGAASVGTPLSLGFEIHQVAIPPDHDYLLATTSQNNWPIWIQVHGDTTTARSMDSFVPQSSRLEPPAGIDGIALSPAGSAAAFFSKSEGCIYAFSRMSQSPTFLGRFEIGTLGSLTAFAINDSADHLAVGTSDGVNGSVFLLSSAEAPHLIASVLHPAAIQFLWKSADAVIADDVDNKVYGFAGGQLFPIATAKDGISSPVFIAVAKDNQKAFVANSGSGSVTRIGPYGIVADPVYCNCTLTGLHPTNTDSVFRLTDFSGRPLLLFDSSSRTPRMTLVPAGAEN